MAKKKAFQISKALTEGLEETIHSAQGYSGQLRIEIIPIKKIEIDPENPRELAINIVDLPNGPLQEDRDYEKKRKELESLQSLANSIRNEGMINPVLVYKFGENYRLVAGERRTLASIIAGKTDIQAKILDKKPTPYKLSLLQWIENIEREDLSLWERLNNLEKMVINYQQENNQNGKITPTTLSKLIGCSLPHAMNYCAVFEADKGVKQHIQDNKIKNLEKAAIVAKICEPIKKDKALSACLAGATLKELKNIAATDSKVVLNDAIIQSKTTFVGRGRQASKVNLGVTKNPKVVKCIIDAVLLNHKQINIEGKFNNIEWNSYGHVTKAFKDFIKALETKL